MVGVFLFIALLLIILSFLVNKYPFILAGYKQNTSKRTIKFIQKSFLVTGIAYLLLSILPFFILDDLILAILSIVPITFMLIVIIVITQHYKQRRGFVIMSIKKQTFLSEDSDSWRISDSNRSPLDCQSNAVSKRDIGVNRKKLNSRIQLLHY